MLEYLGSLISITIRLFLFRTFPLHSKARSSVVSAASFTLGFMQTFIIQWSCFNTSHSKSKNSTNLTYRFLLKKSSELGSYWIKLALGQRQSSLRRSRKRLLLVPRDNHKLRISQTNFFVHETIPTHWTQPFKAPRASCSGNITGKPR